MNNKGMSILKQGNIIWAKLRGHPWWPARFTGICHRKSESFAKVIFIGDDSHAFIPISRIVPYQDKRREYGRTKRKDLLRSIYFADLMIAKEAVISINDKSDLSVECEIQKKEYSRKRKLVITDSDEELEEEICKDTKKSVQVTCKEAMQLLTKLVSEKNSALVVSLNKKVLTAIRVIKKEANDLIIKDIEDCLEKFLSIYKDIVSLKKICSKVNETLKSLQCISTGAYSVENQEAGINSEFPRKFKRLKLSESVEYNEESGNKSQKEIENIKLDSVDTANVKLAITICHELAKLIDEVF